MDRGVLVLKPGRDRSLRLHHPWVFSGAVSALSGSPDNGAVVEVVGAGGEFLAWALLNRNSQIIARAISFNEAAFPDEQFIRAAVRRAVERRQALFQGGLPSACRLIYAESDNLPGLIVDRYEQWLVLQCTCLGMERYKELVARELAELVGCRGVYERSDTDTREKEGLERAAGPLLGEEPPELIEIHEHGARFLVDVRRGQKTGWYLDQRENRRLVAQRAEGREVLNCYSYTAAFAVACLCAGAARVVNVESSEALLELGKRNCELNGVADRAEHVSADVSKYLRYLRDSRQSFDMIILDPPRFALARSQVERACRGYKDINLLALKLLRPGGILATFSCSAVIPTPLFQKVVFDAARDAEREVRIIARMTQSADHPVLLSFPESEYLKGLLCYAEEPPAPPPGEEGA